MRGDLSSHLTRREREVVVMLAEGCTVKDVAVRLDISTKTADAHKTALMRKLDVHDRRELERWAIKQGLVPCPCGIWLGRIYPALG